MTGTLSRARAVRRALLCLSTVLATGIALPAFAQSADPPVREAVDERGVNLATGAVTVPRHTLTVGSGNSALSAGVDVRTYSQVHTWKLAIKSNGASQVLVIVGKRSLAFNISGSTYTNVQQTGETLSGSGTTYTFTDRDGSIIQFDRSQVDPIADDINYGTKGYLALGNSITYANGEIISLKYKYYSGDAMLGWTSFVRLQGLSSSNGYVAKFKYETQAANSAGFRNITGLQMVNTAVDYCNPAEDTCTGLTQAWPEVTLATAGVWVGNGYDYAVTATDNMNRTTTYKYPQAKTNKFGSLRLPGQTSDNYIVTYGTDGRVSGVTIDGLTWQYAWSYAAPNMTTTITKPGGAQVVYVTDTTKQRVTSVKDELNRTTLYGSDSAARINSITYPEGNNLVVTYDARGNVIQQTWNPKPGTGEAAITVTANYDASCLVAVKCNKPNWTRDALNNQTDYVYDPVHGGVVTVTAPADSAGVRPQTRVTYSTRQAYFKNAAGSIGASGQSTYLPTAISQCLSGASCAGTANERKTTIDYGPQVAGTANNLFPVSQTVAAGDNSVSLTTSQTFDVLGNVKSIDGPLPGTQDRVTMHYDALGRQVGKVGPDPDGVAGAGQPPVAQRTTYNTAGQLTKVETGNVADQTDAAFAAFTPIAESVTTYDANGRPIRAENKVGGTTYAVVQQNYDAQGRPDCVAVRMDSAVWNSQTDACLPQTTGPDGPDRISKTAYNAADEVTGVTTALGTSAVATETTSYTANGQVQNVKDGEGNLTTYEYDGHDRLKKTRFPVVAQGANASSTTDYEELTYNANSAVTVKRLRDGSTIANSYDNLGRLTAYTPSGEAQQTLQYNLVGDLTLLQTVGGTGSVSRTVNAVGQLKSESQPFGSASYNYDAGGRMSRLTWADGFFVDYVYDNAGNVTQIRENGALSGLGLLASYEYDNLGQRTKVTRGNGTVTNYTFDPARRLASIEQNLAGTADDHTIGSITYNPTGQITGQTRSNDSYAWSAHYNVNRDYTVNGLNQMTVAGATGLGYDGRGNLITSGSSAYGYDKLNRMISAPGITMGYDQLGRMSKYNSSGGNLRFAYAGSALIQETDGPSGAVLRRYVPGPGTDEPVVWYESATTADRRWLHADERGSVIAVSDGSGAMLSVNRYDEYGIPQSGGAGRFRYTGQAWLSELGMYYYKARMYSPSLGRFMQTDPIGYGDGMNLYNYVGSDPVNATDPSGMTTCSQTITYHQHMWLSNGTVVPGQIHILNSSIECSSSGGGSNAAEMRRMAWAESRGGAGGSGGRSRTTNSTSDPCSDSAPNLKIDAELFLIPASPFGQISGTLTNPATGQQWSFSSRNGYTIGTFTGNYQLNGTISGGPNALQGGLDISVASVGAFGRSWGRTSITSNRGRSLGSGELSPGASGGPLRGLKSWRLNPLALGGVSFDPINVTLTNSGICGNKK
ncbi:MULTISPECIES: RHS repeat-associated core domain-containing protein [unclassified Novosphingobium]|uniref:RHS repeat domain-containing protein n=1 Tax=unclassified Novosphingobium TaxID=2644732 RepID=UPI0025CE7E2A|nr:MULTISPECIES: RHS repeat-associated core domain-containing protein [unclassified Novosphingobium]HQV03030.1 RHS repeat-associated core domain-containing protein [Novosphingobium sp.]